MGSLLGGSHLHISLQSKSLYKPINQILASREKRTRGRLSEAQEIMVSVTEKTSDYEKSLRQARAEAYAYSEAQRAEAG